MSISESAIRNEGPVILEGIGWQTYEHLLRDYATRPSVHLAFDEGRVEIMVLSYEHERKGRVIGELVFALAVAMGIDYECAGSTTFRRESLGKGFEADNSYYFSDLERMRGLKEIDLTAHCAPDLVIEIDISSSSLNKFPIFAGLGIKEVWRFRERELQIFGLSDGAYESLESSQFLPGVTDRELNELISVRDEMGPVEWQRKVWALGRSRGK